jgi:hypothetical protein
MRAAKWKLEDGKKRIIGTLEWRRDFKPDLIPPDEVNFLGWGLWLLAYQSWGMFL